MGSLSRLGPKCFGPMIRGERYPANFKAPKEIQKYDPSYDPSVWLDTYLMAMGIVGHTDLLAACYLPLMMEGDAGSGLTPSPRIASTPGRRCAMPSSGTSRVHT